ncbi:MAG: hypothetical protein WB502_05165 [Thermoactinomyces sp.]
MLIKHDGVVHHPLGGGSYVYKNSFIDYLLNQIKKKEIRISIGAQPNSSPHFGTLIVFCLAFSLAKILQSRESKLKVTVCFEIVDTAPYKTMTIDGIEYQISLRESRNSDKNLVQFSELLSNLSQFSGVDYSMRKQTEFNNQPIISKIIKYIIKRKNLVAPILDPETATLRIRIACPQCGLTDKKGVKNVINESIIKTYCPLHGWFDYSIDQTNKLEFNTPLRNLVRALVYMEENKNPDVPYEWFRITGSDYAGFYQEQLLYKCASILGYDLSSLPIIIYAPLILDWSGSKLSKSLYVKKDAYKYLPSYLVNYESFVKDKGIEGLKTLFNEVQSWVEEPYKLFRHYTVYYFMKIFESIEKQPIFQPQ